MRQRTPRPVILDVLLVAVFLGGGGFLLGRILPPENLPLPAVVQGMLEQAAPTEVPVLPDHTATAIAEENRVYCATVTAQLPPKASNGYAAVSTQAALASNRSYCAWVQRWNALPHATQAAVQQTMIALYAPVCATVEADAQGPTNFCHYPYPGATPTPSP